MSASLPHLGRGRGPGGLLSDLIDETHGSELLVVSTPFNAFLFSFPALFFDPLAAGLAFLDGLFTHNLWWLGGDTLVHVDDGARRDCVHSVSKHSPQD